MSVAKIIEVSAESPTNFQDAVHKGIERAKETVDNIQGAWINEQQVVVKDGAVSGYRVNMRITFLLN